MYSINITMKKSIHNLFSKPRLTISIVALIVLIASAIAYGHIGRSPIVPASITLSNSHEVIASGSNVSLSFPKSGRVETVLINAGDEVSAGQVLARLSAPDAQGAVSQAKGALDLAEAQYASLNVQYANAKKQQDLLVKNAYQTLLSSGLEGTANIQDENTPIISGTYTCGKEGTYTLKPYQSGDTDSGYSMNYSGIENGTTGVKYENSVSLGNCGLQVKFLNKTIFNPAVVWTIAIPNTKSSVYLANKNAYELAENTRDKVLSDLATTIGNNTGSSSVAKAQVDAARGAYQAALGAYQNNVITSPVHGIVTFVDPDLKGGQSVIANKSVISISVK